MVRIGVISDIHGNIRSLEKIIAEIRKKSIDRIICCGDLVAFGPRPVEVLTLLGSVGNVDIVRGNTERWMAMIYRGETEFEESVLYKVEPALRWTIEKLGGEAEQLLNSYPPALDLELEERRIFVRHGSLESDTTGLYPDSDLGSLGDSLAGMNCNIFLCGHTHIPFMKECGKATIINSGSVGMPFDLITKPTWALLELDRKKVKAEIFRIRYDRVEVVEELKNSGMPLADVFAERVRTAKFLGT